MIKLAVYYYKRGGVTMRMKNIYARIAKEHGVTVEEVERDMQEAINYAHQNNVIDLHGNTGEENTHNNENVPSPDEFIALIIQELKNQS